MDLRSSFLNKPRFGEEGRSRPPDGDFREFILNLEQHLEFISVNFRNVNKIVIRGDFNIDLKTSRRSR